tara:strand:- start:59 stop:841 length:783 start_codon:yes stop_codon:yes gene_type:complete
MNKEINISEIEEKIIVNNNPFPNVLINNLLPIDIVKKAESEFIAFKKTVNAGCKPFQKTKRLFEDYEMMPPTIQEIIKFFNSKSFINVLEKKFNLKNIKPDWTLHGGGLHESFNGGFLKVHSDFIYMRKSKLKRVLNLLIYLNSNWDAKWGGAIEFWDKKMSSAQASISPEINNAAIFRTDKNSNHGFPDPIKCPDDITRKSIALYYYVEEKSFFPITLKRTKYFHAVWKRRPNIEEPRFADDHKSLFKKMKLRFFYRFF